MFAEPNATPATWGCTDGAVEPAGIKTVGDEIVTFDESLLTRITVTPLAGAAVPIVTGNAADCPGASVIPDGNEMLAELTTVTVDVVSANEGKQLE